MSKKIRKKSSMPAAAKTARATAAVRAKPSRKAGRPPSLAASEKPKSSPPKSRPKSSHGEAQKLLKAVPSRSPLKRTPGRSEVGVTPRSQGLDLAEGSKAPPFDLPRDGGTHVSLADFAGRKLVIFFYPRANTPGCTREAMDFTRLAKEFAACGTAVIGVSADSIKAQDSFRAKHKLSIPLISDEKNEMLEAYGARGEKSMYGRTFLGILRTTMLVDEDGRIARIWRRVRVDGHAEDVLATARGQ
jgi:thioredoxin-dependent peroxiredoxin